MVAGFRQPSTEQPTGRGSLTKRPPNIHRPLLRGAPVEEDESPTLGNRIVPAIGSEDSFGYMIGLRCLRKGSPYVEVVAYAYSRRGARGRKHGHCGRQGADAAHLDGASQGDGAQA